MPVGFKIIERASANSRQCNGESPKERQRSGVPIRGNKGTCGDEDAGDLCQSETRDNIFGRCLAE